MSDGAPPGADGTGGEAQPGRTGGAARLRGRQAQAAQNDQLILKAAREVFLADPTAPISAVGTNVPASRTVRPCVFAATMRRRKPVNASQGSSPEFSARLISVR